MGAAHQQNWQAGKTATAAEDLFLTNCLTARGVGMWAAGLMGMTGDEAAAYAQGLVAAFVKPGPLDIVATLEADFRARGIDFSEHRLDAVIAREREAAARKVALRVFSKAPGDGGWERRIHRKFLIPPVVVPERLRAWIERHRGEDAA